MLKVITPTTIAPPASNYSHAIEAPPNARWLYVSGQVGVRPDGTMAEGIDDQAHQAWANLKKNVRLDFRQSADDSTAEQMRRSKFSEGIRGSAQTYAMLAIAAHFTDHEPICERAMQEAQRKGTDIAPLVALHTD